MTPPNDGPEARPIIKMSAFDRPLIICLCGSTRFVDEFRRQNLRLTVEGRIVLSIGCDLRSDAELWKDRSPEQIEALKERLDELHKRKIDLCDAVLVINPICHLCTACRKPCEPYAQYRKKDGALVTLSGCCDALAKAGVYIGPSTQSEINYATAQGKPVKYLNDLR